jgi:hypothetical protein
MYGPAALRRAEAFRTMLAQAPYKGKNNLFITHKPNIVDALGKDWFDVKEGEASIFKPASGKYQLVARVQMVDCPKLTAGAFELHQPTPNWSCGT